ncbi:uncharacterized protein TRIADDRAFT_64150 [Trichoplax adhaerens]|uniref:Uncharacterized protein n=1 Tax=Trichoplax adhaerens TaxID=10228 RepID=B3S483_TRIAD|nr:predicted protein [Trichoplax adhaerens]EDV22600.1 predicted protein [Trichoplax adhaerens]|eukprot:XP_002115144.1 predicted protein [Trichoplax adhaerens]
MASNVNIELYLEKHRISSVLEDLMQKIVRETPPDPIKFMIRNLQKLDDKSKGSQDSYQGWGSIQPQQTGSGPSQHKKSRGTPLGTLTKITPPRICHGKSSDFRLNNTTYSQDWQTVGLTDGNAVGSRSRDYNRPWLSGTKTSSHKVNQSDSFKTRKGYSDDGEQDIDNQNYKLFDKSSKGDPLNAFFSQTSMTSSTTSNLEYKKFTGSDSLLSDELKNHGKYYDDLSTPTTSIDKQRAARYQQVKLLKSNHKKQLQELVNQEGNRIENQSYHQQSFINDDEYDDSHELLGNISIGYYDSKKKLSLTSEDSAALAEEGVTRVRNRRLNAPVATRKAINRQGGLNMQSIIQGQFNRMIEHKDPQENLKEQDDEDYEITTARSQVSDTNSLSHIISQPLWKSNQDDDAFSTTSGSRAVQSSVFDQGRYGYRSAEDFAQSTNTARTDYTPDQESSRPDDRQISSRSESNPINRLDSTRTFTFEDNSRHVWRKTQSEVDDTDVSEAGWAPTSNEHFPIERGNHEIVDKGSSTIGKITSYLTICYFKYLKSETQTY